MSEPEPEWNDEDPSRQDFWQKVLVGFIVVAAIGAVFSQTNGVGIEDRTLPDFVFGSLVLVGGGGLCVAGVRARSVATVVAGFVIVALAVLFLLGTGECHDHCMNVE